MLSELNLPDLPDGYRWRFFIDIIGEPRIVLEKHIASDSYKQIGYELPRFIVESRGFTIGRAIEWCANEIYNRESRWFQKPDVSGYIKYVGNRP